MDPREIQSLEELCIQDDAPWCQAACPLHVDARGMLAAVSKRDFETAAVVYGKKVPFPGILSRVCEQPCRRACKRGEVGDPLQIGLVERSCADFVGFSPERPRPGSPRQERVAVVGAGLSGTTAALELARRHYSVTLFEAGEQLGGRLRSIPPGVLPPDVLEAELSLLARYDVEVRLGVRLGRDVRLADMLAEWQAVYLAVGPVVDGGDVAGDAAAQAALAAIDPVTLATSEPGVFAGGSLRRLPGRATSAGEGGAAGTRATTDRVRRAARWELKGLPTLHDYEPALSMADGCRAAVSIDRFLKEESMALHREKEGPYETRLFTRVEGIEPATEILPGEARIGYTRDEAVTEAGRCLSCECLECVKACTYLDYFHEYPGKCIRKVTKNIASVPGKSYRTHTPFLNSCSLCGLCGVVCPTDLNMAVVNDEARRIMWDKGFMPPAIHEFALLDMDSSLVEASALFRNQPGFDSSAYLFFPGCQLGASAPELVDKTYRFLTEKLPGGVGFTDRCCGAPASWSGRKELFQQVLDSFLECWARMGRPRVVVACPTCSLVFKTRLPEVPAVSLWEIVDQVGPPEEAPRGEGRRLAVHDSCTARSAPEIQDSVRRVLSRLGYELEELPYSREHTKCCGWGGLMYLVNQELTGKVVAARIDESSADYVAYCVNCRDFFAGKGKVSYHVLDLFFAGAARRPKAGGGPAWSARRANRRRLAEKLLTELWREPMPEPPEHARLKLRVSSDVAAKMERDFILVDDVQRVIHRAERTGSKLQVSATGRFVAHYRPSLVTYWVEYAVDGDEYEVLNVYSHRMQIVKDV